MNNTAPTLSALIAAARAELAHASKLLERAQHRAEVYTFDHYIEKGVVHYYPAGKAALTRLRKRDKEMARAEARLESLLAREAAEAEAAAEAAEAAARAEFETVSEAVGSVGRAHGFGSPEHRAALPRFAAAHAALVAAVAARRALQK